MMILQQQHAWVVGLYAGRECCGVVASHCPASGSEWGRRRKREAESQEPAYQCQA